MSSYMSVFLSFKGSDEKHMIYTVSRSNDFYQAIIENIHINYSGEETVYNELTESDLSKVLADIREEYRGYEKRLTEYEKYAANNPDYINDILSLKERIEELNAVYTQIMFLRDMFDEDYNSDVTNMYITVG